MPIESPSYCPKCNSKEIHFQKKRKKWICNRCNYHWHGKYVPRIVIIGCGGAGNNTVNRIHHMGISGVETIAINTDKQHLDMIQADKRLLIGKSLTKGLGAGGYPDVGKRAAEMARSTLESLTDTNDLVFVTAGLGGGTGTGSAPVVAKLAKGQGATVIGIVSYPFQVEKARLKRAEDGLEALTEVADTVILIDNNRLKNFVPNLPLGQAFSVMDQLIGETVKGISEIITEPSLINVDDSDVRAVMSKGGVAVMLVGESKQQNKAESVVRECLSNPMLDIDYRGATGSLICITGGSDLTLKDAKEVVTSLTSNLDPHADVIWGTCVRNDMEGKIRVTAIMTGIKTAEIFGTRQSYKAMIPDIEHKRSNPKAVEIPQSRKIQTITNTHFSITSPRKVRPGSLCILDVWAHLEEDRDEILKRIHQSNVDSDQIIRTQGPFDIQKGMKLLIRLEIPDLIIENAENFLLWTGKIANTSFLINVPANQNKGKSIGKVKIFIDGLQIGCIFFELFISNNESPKENIPSDIHLFKKAFISYAHADLDRVLPRIQGIQKAAPHLEIKMDIKDIRSGENWKEKLRDYIQLCDIFYLFWSKNAMVSNCVNKEWQCAYKLKGIDFIDPVPLDSPKEAIPPPELAEKHFDDWILAYSRAQIHSFKENIEGGILEWVG